MFFVDAFLFFIFDLGFDWLDRISNQIIHMMEMAQHFLMHINNTAKMFSYKLR
jgi:hypothetical protein